MKIRYTGPKKSTKVSYEGESLEIGSGQTKECGDILGARLVCVEGNDFEAVEVTAAEKAKISKAKDVKSKADAKREAADKARQEAEDKKDDKG